MFRQGVCRTTEPPLSLVRRPGDDAPADRARRDRFWTFLSYVLITSSSVTLDFGKEVGGLVTIQFASSSQSGQQLGLAFTESSQYVGTTSDASNGGGGSDGAIDRVSLAIAPQSP